MTNTNLTQITATYFGCDRLNNSVNGNPKFKLRTSDGVLVTQSDADINYDIENHTMRPEFRPEDSWVGRKVRFSITDSRRVVYWERT